MVYLMNDQETKAWFMKSVFGKNELEAIKNSRLRTVRPEYKIRALVRRSREAKAAHRLISGRIPGHVYVFH